jgi:hypothetical protein
MKTIQSLSIGVLAVASATLVGCGGGGGPTSPHAGFDSTEFQGNWKRTDRTGSGNPANCFNLNTIGGSYGGLNRPSVITATTITDTVEVYSDTTCTTYLGLLARNYSVTWSAGSLAGKSNVARVVVTSTGFSINRDGASGFLLTRLPPTGVSSKELLDAVGGLLYIGSSSAAKDADGYPTALESTALYTR